MIVPLLATLSFPSPADFIAAFDPVVKKRSLDYLFNRADTEASHLQIDYKRMTDGHLIEINLGRGASQKEIDDVVDHTRAGNTNINPERSPSNIQLGDHSFVYNDFRQLVAVADGFYVEINDPASERNSFAAADARAIEALARVGLAEMIGSTLNENGSPVQAAYHTNQHTHSTYMPLSKISSGVKTKPEVGEWLDQCTVKLGKHKLEFALASDMVSIDGKSVVIEAFVARQKGEWMIPTKTLKQKGIEGL